MKNLVVLTGAGMSAESGISTFRDAGGLWDKYPVEQVATPEGYQRDPALVINFYNARRKQLPVSYTHLINQELFAGDSTKTISKDNFMAGFIAGTLEKGGVMTMEAAQEYTRTAMETIKAKAMEEKYADNKAAGEKFLAENKTKEGVKTTESGLQYKVITEGKGEIPADTCKVKVNYKGTLIDGTEFDSSYKRNEPATFRANQVIKGWTEALTMMPVGSKWELYIPQEDVYKRQGLKNSKNFHNAYNDSTYQ